MSEDAPISDSRPADADQPEAGFAPPDVAPTGPAPEPISFPQPPPWPGQYPGQGTVPPAPVQPWGTQSYTYPPFAQSAGNAGLNRAKRRRIALVAAGGAAVLVVVAILVAGLGKHSDPAEVTSASSATASSDASTGSAAGLLTASPTSALLPVPAGAKQRTADGASADGSLTLDQYLKMLYPTSTTERAALQRRNFEAAATRWFVTGSGDYAAVYLIQFQSAAGAESYALALAASHRLGHPSDGTFDAPGLTGGAGFEESQLDSDGNTRSMIYGSLGNVTVLIHYYVPATLDRAAVLSVLDAQVAQLEAAESHI